MPEQREARILIVDDQRDIARVLRTALELTNRGYFIVDVPSGEEAMLEVQRKEFDILVTDYRLPGMTGPELILKVRKKWHGMKAILITGNPVAEVKKEIREKGIEVLVGIFEKPVDMTAFTAAVDTAVFHEKEKKAQPVVMAEDPLGEIPVFDEGVMAELLSGLMRDLGCNAVVMADRRGKVLLGEGQIDQSLRFSELAVLLAGNFTTTAQITGYLGQAPSPAVHYYEGEWNDIYAISVGLHFFITIVFPGGSQKQMGAILRYGKPAVQGMIGIVGPLALTTSKALEAAAAAAALPLFEETVAEVAIEEPPAEIPFKEAPPLPAAKKGKTAPLPAIDIDIEALDADLAAAGEGNLDDFWNKAAEETDVLADDSISREDAIALGLIPKDEE